jgi:Holliday junction resolvasome RuvABC endonuclease subunit
MKVGIDPGLSGAIAFVSDNKIKLFDMPVIEMPWIKTSKYKRRVDGNKLFDLIKNCPHKIESITIEIVGVQKAQGISSSAAFMGAFHSAVTIANLFMEPIMIRPQKWKAKWGLINMPKDAARLACLKMYPELLPQLKRKKDVDRADALLIAVS